MLNKKIKSTILEEIERIRSGLQEINSVQYDAIELQESTLINQLKKHILDKQNKLDKYLEKLDQLTNDSIAKGLLESITYYLNSTGEEYALILKYESNYKKPSSTVENLKIMLEISSKLLQLITQLERIENILDIKLD